MKATEEQKQKMKEYYKNNKETFKKNREFYCKENKEKLKEKRKLYYKENRKSIIEKNITYAIKNKEKVNEYHRQYNPIYDQRDYRKEYLKTWARIYRKKIWVKLKQSISSSLRFYIHDKNYEHCFDLLGYTVEDLMKHLESQFREGMSWDNYGKGKNKWNIDHIIPISKFNISSKNSPDFKICWSLNNLQPLWTENNVRKSDKLFEPLQPSLDLY